MPRDLFSNQVNLQGGQQPSQSQGMLSSIPQSPSDLEGAEGVKTFLGTMPSVREMVSGFTDPDSIKNAIGTATGLMGGGMALKAGKELLPVAEKAINYLRPGKEAGEFMQNLGGGKTAEENISELAKRLKLARTSAANEALAHKKPVYEELGEKEFKARDFTENSNLIKKWFSDSSPIGELHSKFSENPTLNNSDDLQQQIGSRIGDLLKKSIKEPLDKSETEELADLKKTRESLLGDQDKFIESQSPYLANQNKIFRQKWRENVTPYDENPIISEIARKGTTEGITPSEIKKPFSYPSSNVQKILKDITPTGQTNVLFNELQTSTKPDVEGLVKALREAKQFGYQKYITPKMENMASDLEKRQAIRKWLDTGIGTLGGYAVGGIPGGAIGGALASPILRTMIKNALEKSGGKG